MYEISARFPCFVLLSLQVLKYLAQSWDCRIASFENSALKDNSFSSDTTSLWTTTPSRQMSSTTCPGISWLSAADINPAASLCRHERDGMVFRGTTKIENIFLVGNSVNLLRFYPPDLGWHHMRTTPKELTSFEEKNTLKLSRACPCGGRRTTSTATLGSSWSMSHPWSSPGTKLHTSQ